MVADAQAFVRAMGLNKYILIGHSMGGVVAYNYAASHLDQIERLVIIDIGLEITPAFDQRFQTSLQANDVFDSLDQAFQTMRAGNRFASDDELRRRAMYNMMQRDDGKWTWRYDRALRGGGKLKRPSGEQQWLLLSTITCPTLLVRGAESDLLARETVERMVRTIPNCRVVEIPRAGHTVTADNPEAFIAALRDFLLA
jgi:pimeloyl-ACP methyl ester carboxylesterase